MRLIDADALIPIFSGGEAMKSMSEIVHDERFVDALSKAPTVDIMIYSCAIDVKTGIPSMVLSIGGEKHELTGPPADMKELARKLGVRESDCGPGCARYPACEYNHGRHGVVRINCPLWRAKG